MTTTDSSASTTADTPQKACRCLSCNRWIDPDVQTDDVPLGHCPFCGTDNRAWCQLGRGDHLKRFPVWTWALLAVLLILGSSIALTLNASWKPSPTLRPGQVRIVSISVIIIAIIFYRARYLLCNYELMRQTLPFRRRPSLAWLAVLSLILAGLLALALAFAHWWWYGETPKPASINDFSYLPWLLYLFLVLATAVAIMLLGVRAYIQKLDAEFDRPIYCDNNKLFNMIWGSLTKTCLPQAGATPAPPTDNTPDWLKTPPIVECTSSTRNSAGGLDLVIRQRLALVAHDSTSHEYLTVFENHIYQVVSDKWGEILSFKERSQTPAPTPGAG